MVGCLGYTFKVLGFGPCSFIGFYGRGFSGLRWDELQNRLFGLYHRTQVFSQGLGIRV